MRTSLKCLVAAPLAVALAACVSVLPEQPKPKALFDIVSPGADVSLSANVIIREPDAPRLFASRNMTSVGAGGGFQVVPGMSWVDRSTRLLQTTMIDSFSTDGAGVAVDDAAGVSGDAELYWRVTEFSLSGSEGICSLQLTLLDGRTREPIAQKAVSARSASLGKSPDARAAALSSAGQECVAMGAQFVSDEVRAAFSDDQ